MENKELKEISNKNMLFIKDAKDNQNKIKIIKWDDFSKIKEKDSSYNYYTLIEKKALIDNMFFQSRESLNYVFLSKINFY